jgi:hypothetical protein
VEKEAKQSKPKRTQQAVTDLKMRGPRGKDLRVTFWNCPPGKKWQLQSYNHKEMNSANTGSTFFSRASRHKPGLVHTLVSAL